MDNLLFCEASTLKVGNLKGLLGGLNLHLLRINSGKSTLVGIGISPYKITDLTQIVN